MADPIANAQFAQSLFAALPAMVRQRGQNRATLAMDALQRRRALEDQSARRTQAFQEQQAAFQQQERLTNLTNDRYAEVERERSRRAERTAEETTRRANEREDALRQRTAEREARSAYATYATMAADASESPQPFESFGKNPEDVIVAIREEMSRLQAKQNDAAFKGVVAGYRSRLKNLENMARISPEDIASATEQVVGGMVPEDTKEENWPKAISAIASGSESIGLKLMGPQDRAAFLAGRAQRLQAMRLLKTKDPAYVQAARDLSGLQQSLVEASFKNPKWAKMLGDLDKEISSPESQTGEVDIDAFLKEAAPEKPSTPKTTPRSASASPASVAPAASTYANSGILGLLAGAGRRAVSSSVPSAGTSVDVLRNLTYAGQTIPQMVGGTKLVEALGGNNIDSDLLRARDAVSRHRPWMNATGDAILRAIFPQPVAQP